MNLKTSCEKCVFQVKGRVLDPSEQVSLCGMKNSAFIEDNVQFTNGYCNDKRGPRWFGKHTDLISENSKVDVILNCYNLTIAESISYIRNFKNLNENFTLIVIIKNKSDVHKIFKEIENYSVSWKIDNIRLSEEEFVPEYMLDYAVGLCQNRWAIYVNGDYKPQFAQKIMSFQEGMVKCHGLVCAKFDQYDAIFFNINAFKEMNGNVGKNFLDKLKEFDNWQELCITVA